MSEWTVEQLSNGKCDILRDRRQYFVDADDVEEALDIIRAQDPSASTATLVELDGYPTKVRLR